MSTTTFNYVLFRKNTRKDGSIPVKIRLWHNGKARYFPTTSFVTKDQIGKDGKIKDLRVADAVDTLVRQYRTIANEIDGAQYMSDDELAEAIKAAMKREKGFRLDFFEYAEKKMAGMKPKTAEIYRTSLNALRRFVGKDRLDIAQVNYNFILSFKHFLETEKPVKYNNNTYKAKTSGSRAVSLYLSNIRAIYNRAIDEFNDDYYQPIRALPFKKSTVPPQPKTEHRILSKEQMRMIMDYTSENGLDMMAKDVFLLSFYLVGMNTADIYSLRKPDIKDGVITYNRAKTASRRQDNAMMSIRIEPEAEAILNRYCITIGDDLLRFRRHYSSHHEFNRAVNIHLKNILPGLTTYYARHSWATFALNDCNVPFDTVHFALNHAATSENKVTEIYVKRDYSKIWEANRKVIDFVKNSQ